jgi:hypothetical protein
LSNSLGVTSYLKWKPIDDSIRLRLETPSANRTREISVDIALAVGTAQKRSRKFAISGQGAHFKQSTPFSE